MLLRQFADRQRGTLHFAHLTASGFPRSAHTLHRHHLQLDAELGQRSTAASLVPFIEQFVRPFGIGSPPTPRVANTIEQLAAAKTAAATEPVSARMRCGR